MNSKYTAEQAHKILFYYTIEAGESFFEEIDSIFEGKKCLEYLDFLINRQYITPKQKANWILTNKNIRNSGDWSDLYRHENIENMTYIDEDNYTDDFEKMYQAWTGESNVDLAKAQTLGLIDTPIVITSKDVNKFNEIYWFKVLKIIAEYFVTDQVYEESLDYWKSSVDYYLKNEKPNWMEEPIDENSY